MKQTRTHRCGGFSLFEVLLAAAAVMILMFGALYSTSETFEVVKEGDRRIHTSVQGRTAMDRMLKVMKYATTVDIVGDINNGWTIDVAPTGTLDPPLLTYTWDPNTRELRVSDGVTDDIILEKVKTMEVDYSTVPGPSGDVIVQVNLKILVESTTGQEAGVDLKPMDIEISGSTWVRQNLPSF